MSTLPSARRGPNSSLNPLDPGGAAALHTREMPRIASRRPPSPPQRAGCMKAICTVSSRDAAKAGLTRLQQCADRLEHRVWAAFPLDFLQARHVRSRRDVSRATRIVSRVASRSKHQMSGSFLDTLRNPRPPGQKSVTMLTLTRLFSFPKTVIPSVKF
jgi:hypothetical protein